MPPPLCQDSRILWQRCQKENAVWLRGPNVQKSHIQPYMTGVKLNGQQWIGSWTQDLWPVHVLCCQSHSRSPHLATPSLVVIIFFFFWLHSHFCIPFNLAFAPGFGLLFGCFLTHPVTFERNFNKVRRDFLLSG